MSKPSTIVVALGGNALQQDGEASAKAQERVATLTAAHLIPLIRDGHKLVIVHGNGPQVGNIVLHEEAINTPEIPTMPLDSSVAMSQGLIGYWLQQALVNELQKASLSISAATVVTRVEVDPTDPAFSHPTKPIGPFYSSESHARRIATAREFTIKEDTGRGWRRVVPSPRPQRIIEIETIRHLVKENTITIAAGGGGIPVFRTESGYQGVEAVVDKDFSAAVLADAIKADFLQILTTVDAAMLNYGTPRQQPLGQVTVKELKHYISEHQFAPGSMLPKVEAAMQFVSSDDSRQASIGSIEKASEVFGKQAGTIIHA